MNIHLVLAALFIFGVSGTAKKPAAAAKKKAKEVPVEPKEAPKVSRNCAQQLDAFRSSATPICPEEGSRKFEYDSLKMSVDLDGETPEEFQEKCCKQQTTCSEFRKDKSCDDRGGQMDTPGVADTQFPQSQLGKNCCKVVPPHVFLQGGNWAKHLKDGASKEKLWEAISKHDQWWYKNADGYWFRRCTNEVFTAYIDPKDGDNNSCVIGLEPDGQTINHVGPFGKHKNTLNIHTLFNGQKVLINTAWHKDKPVKKSSTQVGTAVNPNKARWIIFAVLIVGLSTALYMTYKCTRKTDMHYAKLLDEEV